jgi:hypothetical protein
MKYGPIELSGSADSQNLIRATNVDKWGFVQNRNTGLIRLDYDWLQSGKLMDRFDVPFIKRSKLYILYRGVYDGFWGIAPGGRQVGVTRDDDRIGGPVIGNQIGTMLVNGQTCDPLTDPQCVCPPGQNCSRPGLYSRTASSEARQGLAFDSTLREAYIDLAFTDAPVSLRLGRQQVIWGESDQFRLMDVINPLDTTWHLQQEEWDKLRIPLWLIKGIWDMGDIGPISNSFTEVVWNPGDYIPGNKVHFLPSPWAVGIANPVRSGQIQAADPTSADSLLTPIFNLQGTSFLRGNFDRTPGQASDIGVRFHGVTDIPLLHMPGFEFTVNYLYARGRGIGATAGEPFALKIKKVTVTSACPPGLAPPNCGPLLQNPTNPSSPDATFGGKPVVPAFVTAQFDHPYTNIFGTTANWFEGNYTNTVFRLETAYQLGAPFQTANLDDRVRIQGLGPGFKAPLGETKKDVWAGMLGFDRPTWIKWLNPRTTWFITGQFFWSYVNGDGVQDLRGGVLTASENPYYNANQFPNWAAQTNNGFGQWDSGEFTGQIERVQTACTGQKATAPHSPCLPGSGVPNTLNGNADKFLRWEMLTTIAATSFYWGGTFVPFVAVAIDPMNRGALAQLRADYFITNNLIVQPQAKFFSNLGLGKASLDPWGVGQLVGRDEIGFKITYQF